MELSKEVTYLWLDQVFDEQFDLNFCRKDSDGFFFWYCPRKAWDLLKEELKCPEKK